MENNRFLVPLKMADISYKKEKQNRIPLFMDHLSEIIQFIVSMDAQFGVCTISGKNMCTRLVGN